MSRAVSTGYQTGLDANITAPSYLVELSLSPTIYLSTMDAVPWNGQSWISQGAKVEQLTERGGRLVLRNDDNSGSSLVLNNITRDKAVKVYLYYNGDAKEIFRGYLGDAVIEPMKATMDMVASRTDKTQAPRMRITGPVFTKILAPGVLIPWGDDKIRVES